MELKKLDGSYFQSNNLPKFLSADEVTSKLRAKGLPITAANIRALALSGRMPCFFLDGERDQPFFLFEDVQWWVRENLLWLSEGAEMELKVIQLQKGEVKSNIPQELSQLQMLFELPLTFSVSVVYFLCADNKIVYVGQSRELVGRIGQHTKDKKFNRVFYFPVPSHDINRIEREFIALLRPTYNKAMYASTPSETSNSSDIPTIPPHQAVT